MLPKLRLPSTMPKSATTTVRVLRRRFALSKQIKHGVGEFRPHRKSKSQRPAPLAAYTASTRATMYFNTSCEVRNDPKEKD